jgi:hypothetical protein
MADVDGRIDGWWDDSTADDSRCGFQSLGPPPSLWQPRGATSTAQEISVLDNAFVLIEGHPTLLPRAKGFATRREHFLDPAASGIVLERISIPIDAPLHPSELYPLS